MKFIIFFLLSLVLMVSLASALQNNYYFTITPGGEKCIYLTMPKDSGSYAEGDYSINVTSLIPVNINSMQTYSSINNKVEVPICFSAQSLNENDFGDYEISISSSNIDRKVSGGICISSIDDVDVINEEGSACDLMNTHSDLFSASLPTVKYARIEENNTIRLSLRSSEDIEIEYNVSSDLDILQRKGSVLLEKGKVKYIDFEFTPDFNGRFNFSVDLSVIIDRQYCEFPFCKKTLNSLISVGSVVTQNDWEFTVFPLNSQTDSLEYVEYVATINNYGKNRRFDLDVGLPAGLDSDFRRTSFELNASQTMTETIKVKPVSLDQRLYWITFTASSDRMDKELASLNVGEAVGDICRKYPQACKDPPKIEGCRVYGSVIDISCVNGSSSNINQNQTQYSKPEERPVTDILPILIPILAAMIIVIYYFFSRRKVV